MPISRSAESDDNDHHAGAKRRKIRKGTRSCWACKRRKEKCLFDSHASQGEDSVACIGCRRRGTKCVSQEYVDNAERPLESVGQIGERMGRMEALLEQLMARFDGVGAHQSMSSSGALCDAGGVAPAAGGIPTPASTLDPDSRRGLAHGSFSIETHGIRGDGLSVGTPGVHALHAHADSTANSSNLATLSWFLQKTLPSKEDLDTLRRASSARFTMLNLDCLITPYTVIEQSGLQWPDRSLVPPAPNAHPVLIARYLLRLANLLQHLHPLVHDELRELTEAPRVMMERMANAAIAHVNSQDRLLGSIEGLECVLLESVYHSNCGSVRLSWLAGRRAMLVGQLMGLHSAHSRLQYQVLDPETRADPHLMWFRIVHYDRHLCLILGLPEGSNDRGMAADSILATDTPVGRLERVHCVIAARILERNTSDLKSPHNWAITQDLDRDLQTAARNLPSRWWLAPNLADSATDHRALFWEVRRLSAQLYHYNLLNQVHVPYMVLSLTDSQYEYSKAASMNASRELVARFIASRRFDRVAFSCRTADFLGLMGALTLLLVYLDTHHRSASYPGSLPGHQYLIDRAMIEEVQDIMQEVSKINADALSAESADLLRRLLIIEADAAGGKSPRTDAVGAQDPNCEPSHLEDMAVSVHIPYFGLIKISRNGLISKQTPNVSQPTIGVRTNPFFTPDMSSEMRRPDGTEAGSAISQPSPQNPGRFYDPTLPSLTASAEDWTFQGIDLAFFDSWMRGAGDDV